MTWRFGGGDDEKVKEDKITKLSSPYIVRRGSPPINNLYYDLDASNFTVLLLSDQALSFQNKKKKLNILLAPFLLYCPFPLFLPTLIFLSYTPYSAISLYPCGESTPCQAALFW